jgi:hypothetical protein
MRHLHRECAGIVLMLALAVPVFAGQIPCGVTDPQPEPEPTAEASGDIHCGLTEAIVTALQTALSVF